MAVLAARALPALRRPRRTGWSRNGRALEQLPAVAAACADGRVTAEQVAVIAPVARPENVAAAAAAGRRPRRRSTPRWPRSPPPARTRELAQVVHHYLARLDPDGPEPDPTEDRSLSIAKHADGSVTGRGRPRRGRRGEGAGRAGVDRAGQPARRATSAPAPSSSATPSSSWPTTPSPPAHLPFLRTVKPHVVVTIGIDDLADPHTGPGAAATGFGARISAARARWLACDGNITRIVIGPDGQPLDLGRSQAGLPAAPAPGRSRSATRAACSPAAMPPPTGATPTIVLEWVLDDGPTSVENGALLCERHHTKVHHGFRIERHPDGRWRTWRPDGTEILLHPHAARLP